MLESLKSGGLAAAIRSLAQQVLSSFLHEGTWAVDWTDYRAN